LRLTRDIFKAVIQFKNERNVAARVNKYIGDIGTKEFKNKEETEEDEREEGGGGTEEES